MKYSVKVWLFTVLTSPMLLMLFVFKIFSLKPNELSDIWVLPTFMIAYGLILSVPAMLLFWLLQRKLINTLTTTKVKLFLSAYAFVSVWITFYLFDPEFMKSGFPQLLWVLIYSLTLVLGVWIFRLKDKNS